MSGSSYWAISVILAVVLFHSVQGSILLSDSFSYPDGPLVEVSAGVWKTHSGTAGQVGVVSGQVRLSQKKSEDVSAAFPGGAVSTTNAASLFARFDVSFTTLPTGPAGGYFAHFKDGATTTGLRCRIFATTNAASPGRFRLGIAAASSTAAALLPQELTPNTTYTVVCRMHLEDHASTLWLNPTAETDPGVAAGDSAPRKQAVAFAFRESLTTGSGMGELVVDNLIVATSFIEVCGNPLRLRIRPNGRFGIRLDWPSQPDRTYSVWAADNVAGEFVLVATDLWFPEETGVFEDAWSDAALRCFRICTP